MFSILIKKVILNGKKQDIFIEGNRIKKIGKNLNFKAEEKIDGKGEKVVIPGLINCHTHSAMILFRELAEDLPLKDWLEKEICPKNQS
jgi:5-methylthioadenosine/S-adenosylhomocysteine deaminase